MANVASADVAALAQALRDSGRDAEATTHSVLLETSNMLKGEMEARVPVRTGRLKQSIQIRQAGSGAITVGPDTEYAAFVEFGTKPHTIEAKPGKALAFMVNGQLIYRRKVNHPGTRAQPYVRPAFEAWVDTLGELVAEAQIERLGRSAK